MSASRLRSFAEANARSFEALKQGKRWTPLSKSINYTTVAEVLRSLNPSKGNAHLATTIQATTPTMQRGGGGPKYGKVSDVHVEFYQAKHRVPNQSIPATQELRHQSKLQTMLHPLPSRKRSKSARLPQRTHEHTHTHALACAGYTQAPGLLHRLDGSKNAPRHTSASPHVGEKTPVFATGRC